MNTVLAVWHSGGKGKTQTIRKFADLLLIAYPSYVPIYPLPAIVPASGDFRLIVEVNGIIVGIESQGDPHTNLKNRLLDLVDNYKCELVICSSRTRGETVDAVDNLHFNRGFQSIWTSTYQIDGTLQQTIANRSKGKHILELLQSLGLI